jgi:mannose-6-phosphate isomerase-like protein (cupin superfamily)
VASGWKRLPRDFDQLAPDGSEVRELQVLPGLGGMAHFRLPAGGISLAVRHATVSEIWYILAGSGEMWIADPGGHEVIIPLEAGVSFTIPVGHSFQFRADAVGRLDALGLTMPPWPGAEEASRVDGHWPSDGG